MQWTIKLPIFGNTLFWQQLLLLPFLSSLPLLLLLLGLNLYEEQWENLPDSFLLTGTVMLGFTALLALIAVLLFGRGMETRYVLGQKEAEQHTQSKIAKVANRVGVFGLLTGTTAGLTTTGASLISRSRESIAVNWKEVDYYQAYPQRGEIRLYNDWRVVMQIVCPKEQFQDALIHVQQYVTSKQAVNPNTATAIKVILSGFAIVFAALLFPPLPILFVGLFTLLLLPAALFALWSTGKKRVIAAVLTVLLPLLGVGAAFYMDEVELYPEGAMYALAIEIALLSYFVGLGISVLLRWLR